MTSPRNQKTRVENTFPLAREGLPFIGIGTALTLLAALLGFLLPTMILALLTLFTAWFFRDPERTPDGPQNAVYSPADGKVIKTVTLDMADNPLGSPCVLVCIFMSLFNVHVNRMITNGVVSSIRYHAGRFFSANLDKASEQNERNRVTLETEDGKRLAVVQVAGLVARRIACWVEPGDRVRAGQRFGLIRFGSRLDVYLPENTQVAVQPGQGVKAGQSVIAYLH
jgi:phosphatidylserine decarboxylase